MNRFLGALTFLTILPLPQKGDFQGSVPFFPLVGLLIGGVMALLAWGLSLVFPPLPSAALLVLALVFVSKGLHLDGLSDTADGFLSSRDREGILRIMKDSHVGAMGAMAIAFTLLLKVTALSSISAISLPLAAFLMPVAGRVALPIMMALLPYARPEGGLGGLFSVTHPRFLLLFSVAILFLAAGFAGGQGLVAAGGTLLLVLLFIRTSERVIGGMTGDTLGAACEIAETGMALFLSALF